MENPAEKCCLNYTSVHRNMENLAEKLLPKLHFCPQEYGKPCRKIVA
jgi:hypothetical protein